QLLDGAPGVFLKKADQAQIHRIKPLHLPSLPIRLVHLFYQIIYDMSVFCHHIFELFRKQGYHHR
ncbi:MAG: hypothetical protein RR739_05240, partial [Clostridia bacterium]